MTLRSSTVSRDLAHLGMVEEPVFSKVGVTFLLMLLNPGSYTSAHQVSVMVHQKLISVQVLIASTSLALWVNLVLRASCPAACCSISSHHCPN
jgi:hypothetical protein